MISHRHPLRVERLEQRDVPAITATYAITQDWGSGFQGQITLHNGNATPVSDWQLAFDYGANVTSIWDAQLTSHTGSHYLIRNNGWNSTLAAGGEVSFGFVASPPGTVSPANYTLNGVALGSDSPAPPVVPVAANDSVTTAPGVAIAINVLGNDTFTSGTLPRLQIAIAPKHGTVTINRADRSITYDPATAFVGVDTFAYTITDAFGQSASGRVTVNVVKPPVTRSAWPAQVFAPFVDMTLWPTYNLADTAQTHGVKYFTLAFITADTAGHPSWGGYSTYGVDGGAFDLGVRSQIAQVRGFGGNVAVSFGGANGTELAQAITTAPALQSAYQSVITAYGLTRIDFDIEGGALQNTAANARRNQAIVGLQAAAAAAGRELQVWFTLPVLPTGLTPEGVAVLASAKAAGVNIAGVNVMAMDYGDSAAPTPAGQMATYAIQAGTSTFNQLRTLYGSGPSDAQLWAKIGITPMIGRNDVSTEVFDTVAGQQLLAWARQKHIGMIAMWSLNRDHQDPAGALPYAQATSSSILQATLEFADIFKVFTT